jgi:hypothetical protein
MCPMAAVLFALLSDVSENEKKRKTENSWYYREDSPDHTQELITAIAVRR